MKSITTLVLAALVALPALSAAATRDSFLFAFLYMEPGGRPGGLGKSFTAVADDTNAGFYNPGGYALQEKNGVSVMHEPRGTGDLKDMFYDYVGMTYGFGKYGRLGATVTYHNSGKIQKTNDQGEVTGYMHAYDVAPSVYWSYALLPEKLGVGAGLTYAYEHLTDEPGGVQQQPLFNAGVFYRTPLPRLNVGAAFVNLGTNVKGTRDDSSGETVTYSSPPPRTVRLGVAYTPLSNAMNDLLVTADGSKLLMNLDEGFSTELGQGVYSGGVEYKYAKMVSIRGGYYYDFYGEITGLALGFGFAYKGIGFDYARIPEGSQFENRNRFAVSYTF